MARFDDVRRIALALPETSERPGGQRGGLQWRVKDKLFVWDRPLGNKDRADLGDAAPDGDILGLRVADEGVKQSLIEAAPDVYFTIPHFNGYNAVLIRLAVIEVGELEEVITEAWLDRAPPKVAAAYLDQSQT